ncbi:MAG: hypothetical protein CL949_00715 [Erythrobacter sp.]|nr:hypothetical protein [Erythrobacter sp.]
MWLIDRHSDGHGSRRIPLPDVVRSALVRWYIGEGSRSDEEAGITLVQQARLGEKWLACDCLADHEPPPILTPAFLSEAETYYLRRLTGAKRPEHLPDCPFFRDQATNRMSEIRPPHSPADPPEGFFEVLRPAPEKLAQKPESASSDDRTRHASVPRLARLLWRLMSLSGVQRTPPPQEDLSARSIADEFRALSAAAARIEIAPGIELGRVLWTHALAFHSNRVYAGLRELSRQWPRGHAPQAFLALYASAVQGSTIIVAGAEPVTLANRVQSPSIRGNVIKGPYLVLVVVGEYPEAHGYAALRAYAQPIVSGQRFVPVDSEFERAVYRSLLETRRLLDKAGVDLVIEKPLFDRLTQRGACRPDFLLEARSRATGEVRQLIVEAMGFVSDDYLAAKAVTHPRMELIAPILSVSVEDVDRAAVPSMIRATLRV